MPRRTLPLADTDIRTALREARGAEKARKLFDGAGLYALIEPPGRAVWRFKYRFDGREKLLSLGAYPEIPLKIARERREEARSLVARGIDPSAQRKAQRSAQADTLKAIATEWFELQKHKLSASTVEKDLARLETYIFPSLGNRPLRGIKAPELLTALRRIEAQGTHETAHRTSSAVGRVMRFAIATGRGERDITADLRGALAPVATTNYAAITEPKRIGELLRSIDGYQGQPAVAYALKLAPLVFVRPGELRGARWSEFSLGGKTPEWRIPAERMKMGEQHVVPLSRQAVALLKDLKALTGDGELLFPGLRTSHRPISNNTLNAALRRIGFAHDEHTAHGFRSMASTCLNEQGFHPDLIELQLAHAPRDDVRAAYNKAQRLEERRKMMQKWADYLDGLRAVA